MPYDVSDSQPDCSGWATVKENSDGSLETVGCHKTKREAIAQMVAVTIATEHERVRRLSQFAVLRSGGDDRMERLEAVLRYSPDQPRDENGRWSSTGGGFETSADEFEAVTGVLVQNARDSGAFVSEVAGDEHVLKARAAAAVEARLSDVTTDELIATMGNSEYLNNVKRVFIDEEPWEEIYPKAAAGLQHPAEEYQLRLGMDETGLVSPYFYHSKTGGMENPGGTIPVVDVDYTDAERAIRTSIVARHINGWAQTSNDHNARSLLMQEAVEQEFDVKNAAGWDVKPEALAAEMGNLRPTLLPVQRKIARAMYDETQSTLAKAGIKEMSLVRGVEIEGADRDFPGTFGGEVQMRPMSSWSTDVAVAGSFGGGTSNSVLLSTTVPASRVFSLPGTGFGCFGEQEVVVLGGLQTADSLVGEAIEEYFAEGRAYDPSQPRDETGKWTSGGGGGGGGAAFVEKLNDPSVRDLTVMEVTDATDRLDYYGEVVSAAEDAVEAGEESEDGEYDVRGYEMMMSALDSGGDVFIIHNGYAPDGAMNLLRPTRAKEGPPELEIEYLGTSGGVDGAGSRLFAHAVRVAAEEGREITLVPLDSDAKEYWESMGFVKAPDAGFMSARLRMPLPEVQRLAAAAKVSELQTEQEMFREEDDAE